ncbi:MAG: NAD(P)-dependent oxidoreductase [Hoeflea sp.]|uniref:NAD-dependent epimerase/dehydratase family protein n=1 Tax=Hoeflea sp. TaxID=1940281 RepID=UPI002730260B|nr:NAD(P)-dependent oxidoreductase [Hoeflea sp.]MDP2118443.1 NAD(P)-dependent oxidoreductase [Hoeflea sp.]
MAEHTGGAPVLQAARVVVTGAGGVIGSLLVRRLAQLGAAVTAVDLHSPDPVQQLPSVDYIAADVMDVGSLRPHLDRADIVYHLAYLMGEEANADPVGAARINTLGGTQIFQACLEARAGRVLMASSISVYGTQSDYQPHNLPLNDTAPQFGARGIPVYAAGKVYLEKVAGHYRNQHGLLIGGLRPGAVIGRGRSTGRAKTVANIVSAAASGQTVRLDNGKAAFQAIHVDDVVGAFLALATVDPATLYQAPFLNLAGDYATVRSYCDDVARVLPDARFEIADGESDELFGSSPFVMDDGIHRMVGFERRHRSLNQAIRAEVDELARVRAMPENAAGPVAHA